MNSIRETIPLVIDRRRAPLGIAVGQHGLLDLGQGRGARHRGPLVEERLVLELEHGQVDARADRLDLRRQLVARLVALDEELAGVGDHVGVGEDPLALDDDPGAAGLAAGCAWSRAGEVGELASSR